MYMQYPADRLVSPLFQGSNPPNISYNMINVNPQLTPYLPYIAHALAISMSEKAMVNPLRVYTFNKYSVNGFNNQEFLNMVATAADVCMRNQVNFNDYNMVKGVADQIVNHYCAVEYRDNMQTFTQLLDQVTSSQLYEYLIKNNMITTGVTQQVMPMGNYGQGSAYTGGGFFGAPQASMPNTTGDDRYSPSTYGDKNMDRSQHNMGYQQPEVKQPVIPAVNRQINSSPVREEDPAMDIHFELIRSNSQSIECTESFGSFSDLADKIYTDYEKFFKDNAHFDFNYIRMNNYEYSVGVAPFTREVLSLDLKNQFHRFFNGEISSVEMNKLLERTPKRLAKVINIFLDNLKYMVNNLLATSKCGTRFDDNGSIIEDMRDLIISVQSKGRPELTTDLKIALELWVKELFDVREFVDEDNKDASCYRALTKIDVVLVNLTSAEMDKLNHTQLDFLCEMRSVRVFIVTTNNVLYSVTFCSQYTDGQLRHYVPLELRRMISLY